MSCGKAFMHCKCPDEVPTVTDKPKCARQRCVRNGVCTCSLYGSGRALSPVQQQIKEVGTGVVDLLLKKNKDYGSSIFESPILFPELKAKDCILIRMSDKIKRFSNLVSNDETPEVDESIADTMKDLAGYAILWLVANSMETTDAVPGN